MEDLYKRSALRFKAMCDENRLRIIDILRHTEKCGGTLIEEMNIAQSTLSHHMRILVKSEIVKSRKKGKWIYYSLSDEGCAEAKMLAEHFLTKDHDYGGESENCCDDPVDIQ